LYYELENSIDHDWTSIFQAQKLGESGIGIVERLDGPSGTIDRPAIFIPGKHRAPVLPQLGRDGCGIEPAR